MDFKKELVINFIEYNKATYKPESSVGYLAMLMNWFCGILCGLLGAYPIFTSIILLSLNIYNTILYNKFEKDKSYSNFCLLYAISGLNFSVIALVGAFKVFTGAETANLLTFMIFILAYLMVLFLWIFFIKKAIRKDKFKGKFGNYKLMMTSVFSAGVIGILLGRVIPQKINQGTDIFGTMLLIFIALLSSGSVLSIIKYHLMKKYSIDYYE